MKGLAEALVEYLPKQRWFAGDDAGDVAVGRVRVLRDGWPALVQAFVTSHGHRYQLLLGLRPIDDRATFLEGKADVILGEVESDWGPALAYDMAIDGELSLVLLRLVDDELDAERARFLGADQSNTSIVFDDRLILKVFRRLQDGPNPDALVTGALAAAGFAHVPAPVASWQEGDVHLAVVSEFLAGGVDGFHLALTSLRDLYDARVAPHEAGGDFGPDARRLGAITAELHLALAEIFGVAAGAADEWRASMVAQLDRIAPREKAEVGAVFGALSGLDVGPGIRVHGDYHLGQALRTDSGWYVLDFEGEPARALEERLRPSSPLRDVAGMLRSFDYAAEVALREYGYMEDDEARALARAWERRNVVSFLRGYRDTDGIDRLLPPDETTFAAVLAAFVLDKAVYEVGYEASHRPDWVSIPESAIRRILEETSPS
jgi:maltokinase